MGIFRQFPYANFHDLNLDWILNEIKRISEEWIAVSENLEKWKTETDETFKELKDYVLNYFEESNIKEELIKYLDDLKDSGYFDELIAELFMQKDNIICDMRYSNFYNYQNNAGYPNGACYIGNNKIAQYLASDTSNIGKLVIIDTESWIEIGSTDIELKHGNSLTYVEDEKRIYAVSLFNIGAISELLNEVKIVNVEDPLNPIIENTISLPMPAGSKGVYSLAYDRINEEFCATCKDQPTGSVIAGQVNRMVIYNKDLTEIKREVFMDDNLIIDNQGIQLYHNHIAYMNYGSFDFRGLCSYDTLTGKRVNAYTLPKYISGYRYVGELETFIYNYDTNKYYGVSALYGSGVNSHIGLSIFEMGLYQSIPNIQITPRSFNLYNTRYATINIQNGKEGIIDTIAYAPCFMDAVNICILNNIRGDFNILSGFADIGSIDIVGLDAQIRGSATAHAKFMGGVRIFNSTLRFTYSDFSGSVTHVYISGETGNIAIYDSVISMQECLFTLRVLASDSILNSAHRMKPLTALRSILTGAPNTLVTNIRYIESVPLEFQTT